MVVDEKTKPRETIPFAPEEAPQKRDRSGEAPCGNSVSYGFRRLEKQAPELAEKVARGEITTNAAAKSAGFRKPVVNLPVDVPRLARGQLSPRCMASYHAIQRADRVAG
jgi:hypothetical protein